MKSITSIAKSVLRNVYVPVLNALYRHRKQKEESKKCKQFERLRQGVSRIFYFGITIHPNLGDLAQRYCITKWIKENYPNHELVMMESDVIVNPKLTKRFFMHLGRIYGKDDVIVFQSGYCTQDLGGNHPLMHRMVIDHMPDAKILMMPQTIYFQNEENKRLCAENHNKAKNMLFLARDFVSYEMGKEMFPNIRVKAYPDIVTTLIGTLKYDNPREGVCLCTRNDGDKLYSKEEIDALEKKFVDSGIKVFQKDTQATQTVDELVRNLQHYIETEIESYSHYKVTITDRYHGTIFSLCAGTPVIIIKTNDHKVTTGADWFKGVYDGYVYVYVAKDLDDAYQIAFRIICSKINHDLISFFKTEYYDKLRDIFEQKNN